jgi:hypothetical protein
MESEETPDNPGSDPLEEDIDHQLLSSDEVPYDADDDETSKTEFRRSLGRERDRKRGIKKPASEAGAGAKKSRSRTRSSSRSRVLTEKVLFYEQVWQGSGGRSPSLDHLAPSASDSFTTITTTTRTRSERFLNESPLPKGVEELERRLEEKRRRYRSGDRGNSPFLENISLRRTPSRENFSDVPTSPSPTRFGASMERDEGRRSGMTSPQGLIRKKTVSYEEVFEDSVGDGNAEGGSPIHSSHSHVPEARASPSGAGEFVRTKTISSTSTSKHTVLMTKYETRSQVIPGRRSVKYEMSGSGDTEFRNRTPSSDTADGSGTSAGTHVQSNKKAKYEFLGVQADAINRSRTPSGGGAFSASSRSLGGASPRFERSSLANEPGDLQQRKLIVTTTEEVTTFRTVRSPSSGIGSPAESVCSSSFQPSQKTFHEDFSYNQRSVGLGSGSEASIASGTDKPFDDVEERILSSSVSRTRSTPTPDHSGWSDESNEFYSKYKSQIGSASTAGRFETDVTKSAKAKSAFFDSHIAEIRGKKNLTFTHVTISFALM